MLDKRKEFSFNLVVAPTQRGGFFFVRGHRFWIAMSSLLKYLNSTGAGTGTGFRGGGGGGGTGTSTFS